MGQYTHQMGFGNKPFPPKTEDKISREEALSRIDALKEVFSMQSENIYHLSGNISIHMRGSAAGKLFVYNGEFVK